MDNFIDKLAQKFTAGELIKANQAAEAGELKKLQEQVAEYERCLQEMRKLQMRNTEAAEGLKQLMEQSKADIRSVTDESLAKLSRIALPVREDKSEERMEQLIQLLEKNQKEIGEWFKRADEFLHKENVKVYRNVQAVVVDEIKGAKEAILAAQEGTTAKYYKKMIWILVLTFLTTAAGVVIQVMNLYGMF